ncbi:hypothetical protein SLE2022_376120 [Rubroshorea leprosula]
MTPYTSTKLWEGQKINMKMKRRSTRKWTIRRLKMERKLKKKKDKECKNKEDTEGGGKEKHRKIPKDKKNPTFIKAKLIKLESKVQALALKKEELQKLLEEAEKSAAANPNG